MDARLLRILDGKTEHYPYSLENKYPRVFGKLISLWDAPEINAYFMELMVDQRGDRAGFPPDVAAEIVHLSLIHAAHHHNTQTQDVWEVASTAFVDYATHPESPQLDTWKMPDASHCAEIQKLGGICTQAGFFQATETGQRAIVALFLAAHNSTELRNERGSTPLMLAAFYGQATTLELLLEHGANVYAQDSGGNTALHWAAFSGHLHCAQQLIAQHAEIDARSQVGWTPLLQATARRHLELVLLLINHGANLDQCAQDGNTALHKAAAAGYLEIIRPLLAHHANTTLKNLNGETAVKLAIKNKQEAAVKLLLS